MTDLQLKRSIKITISSLSERSKLYCYLHSRCLQLHILISDPSVSERLIQRNMGFVCLYSCHQKQAPLWRTTINCIRNEIITVNCIIQENHIFSCLGNISFSSMEKCYPLETRSLPPVSKKFLCRIFMVSQNPSANHIRSQLNTVLATDTYVSETYFIIILAKRHGRAVITSSYFGGP
jgi:hypothetical protein